MFSSSGTSLFAPIAGYSSMVVPMRVSGEVSQRETMFGEFVGDGAVNVGGKFAVAHHLARRFHRIRIGVGHALRRRAGLALESERAKTPPNSRRCR